MCHQLAELLQAIRNVLGHEPEIELVADAENFAQTLTVTRKFNPT
jgi:hypothetical protein